MIIFATVFWAFFAFIGLLHVAFLSGILISILKNIADDKRKQANKAELIWKAIYALIVLVPIAALLFHATNKQPQPAAYSVCVCIAMFYACVLSRIWWTKRAHRHLTPPEPCKQ